MQMSGGDVGGMLKWYLSPSPVLWAGSKVWGQGDPKQKLRKDSAPGDRAAVSQERHPLSLGILRNSILGTNVEFSGRHPCSEDTQGNQRRGGNTRAPPLHTCQMSERTCLKHPLGTWEESGVQVLPEHEADKH